MSAKRALVVDDSKSARMFLSRILERHEIAVDAAESAEQAIDYLQRNRPDVIFMDHMMPGMDGFQAVQSIKNNPRTSSIPILMYTSQEGDLYLGQARALGAEGVLPKQIKQSDVTRMLYQLRLVNDRREEERIAFAPMSGSADLTPANESAIQQIVVTPPPAPEIPTVSAAPASTETPVAPAAPAADIANLLPQLSLEIRAALDTSLQKEIAALRGYIGSTLSAHADRVQGDLAVLLPAPHTPDMDQPAMVPDRRPWGAISGWALAVVALAAAGFLYFSWSVQGNEVAVLRSDLAAAVAEAEALRAKPEVVSQAAAPADETFVATDGSAPAAAIAPPAAAAAPTAETSAVAPAAGAAPGAAVPAAATPATPGAAAATLAPAGTPTHPAPSAETAPATHRAQ